MGRCRGRGPALPATAKTGRGCGGPTSEGGRGPTSEGGRGRGPTSEGGRTRGPTPEGHPADAHSTTAEGPTGRHPASAHSSTEEGGLLASATRGPRGGAFASAAFTFPATAAACGLTEAARSTVSHLEIPNWPPSG